MSLSVDQDLAGFITHYYKKCYQAGTQGGHFQDQLIMKRSRRQNQNDNTNKKSSPLEGGWWNHPPHISMDHRKVASS